MSERTFEERYQESDIPWDRDHPDENLIQTVQVFSIRPGRALDLGCGTGINARWLADQGFEVTGLDLSPTAIETAKERTGDRAEITLVSGDFLEKDTVSGPFDFVFDRGGFHCFEGDEGKQACAERIADLLPDRGLWLSLIGTADDVPREDGPPTLTAAEIATFVEPRFEIISLTAGHFGGGQDDPPKAWIGLMRKRGVKTSNS